MKCIFGSVVGRKFQKVSHKVAKVRCTKKEEQVVLENMHEPIIDVETWNKVQRKLDGYAKVRNRKYNHVLKGLVYCGECGSKATLRYREEKRKDGSVWAGTYFICSKRNSYSGLCRCKQISTKLVEEVVKGQLKLELEKINLTDEEITKAYKEAEQQINLQNDLENTNLEKLEKELKKIEQDIDELYQDKIDGLIRIEDFKAIYVKKQERRDIIVNEVKQIKNSINQNSEKVSTFDLNTIKQIANEVLNVENLNKVLLEQLIDKIEFDKQRVIKIRLLFK